MQTTFISARRLATCFISCLLLMFTTQATAQSVAEVWLNKAVEKLQNKGAEIAFRINEENIHLSGKLLIEGEKFLYDTEDMKIWYDGATQWTLQQGNGYNELYINSPTPEEQQGINPYTLLNAYEKNFTAMDGGEKNFNGKLVHQVKLTANDNTYELNSVNVYILSDGTLAALEIITTDGIPYEIEVRSMSNGLTFPKGTFIFPSDNYKVDETIDMR